MKILEQGEGKFNCRYVIKEGYGDDIWLVITSPLNALIEEKLFNSWHKARDYIREHYK